MQYSYSTRSSVIAESDPRVLLGRWYEPVRVCCVISGTRTHLAYEPVRVCGVISGTRTHLAPLHTVVRVAYLCTRTRTRTGHRWCAVVRKWYEYEYRYWCVPIRTGSAEDSLRVRRNIRPRSYLDSHKTYFPEVLSWF